jgi:hypothetical protein
VRNFEGSSEKWVFNQIPPALSVNITLRQYSDALRTQRTKVYRRFRPTARAMTKTVKASLFKLYAHSSGIYAKTAKVSSLSNLVPIDSPLSWLWFKLLLAVKKSSTSRAIEFPPEALIWSGKVDFIHNYGLQADAEQGLCSSISVLQHPYSTGTYLEVYNGHSLFSPLWHVELATWLKRCTTIGLYKNNML